MSSNYSPAELAEIHSRMVIAESQNVVATVDGNKVYVTSPYSPLLVQRINNTKPKLGKWVREKSAWEFSVRKIEQVKALYLEVYGENGFDDPKRVSIRLDVDKAIAAGLPVEKAHKGVYFKGKILARLWDYRSAPKVQPGVHVEKGGFIVGGTEGTPELDVEKGTVLVIDEIPQSVVDDALASPSGDVGVAPAPGGTQAAREATAAGSAKAVAGVMPSGNANGGILKPAAGPGDDTTFEDLSMEKRMNFKALEACIKALGLRASQLPKDQVEPLLAEYGLKFKD